MRFTGLILILLVGIVFKCISCFPEHRNSDSFDDSKNDEEQRKPTRKREVDYKQEVVAVLNDMFAGSTRLDTSESGKKLPFNSMHFQSDNNFFTFISTFDNAKLLEFIFERYFSESHRTAKSSMYDTLNNSMTKFSKETTELTDDLLSEVKRMDDFKEKEPEFKNASMQVKSLVQRLGAFMNNITSHVTQYVSRIESDMRIIQGVFNTSETRNGVHPKPTSCDDVDKSGVHTIYPEYKPSGLEVYCEIDQGKAWLVIQRRKYGTVDFDRSWEEYKTGFGNLTCDFWLGNEYIYHLTKYKSHQLRIDMETFEGKKAYAMYDEFGVSSETGKYKLSVKGFS
ncbi:hypothetical protein DPMN_186609 [Dreissena polymorpha]|uniref:Fibrinogen C-terminal domain-containing protein n=1 Tax=Dreissena polymorpha TaxID=45954 RepID=A0A9D4DMH0_DREPO|nr:hypothetical protein DPMN_186609 [Dreissena polymorpha]